MDATAYGVMNDDQMNIYLKKKILSSFLEDTKTNIQSIKSKRSIDSHNKYIKLLEKFIDKLDEEIKGKKNANLKRKYRA